MITLYRSLWGIMPALFLSVMAPAATLEGLCVSVADGDTATIQSGAGSRETIRFWGIDAPESNQKYGQEAKKKLAGLILNKSIRVEYDSRDHHKRILGHVYVGATYTNLEMVKSGLAWHYVQYAPNATEFKNAEAAARKARLGLWQQSAPMAPWEFRHPTEKTIVQAAEQADKQEAVQFKYWVSNSGKTHNRGCKMFLKNAGSGTYTNPPSGVNAGCCGGAAK